MFLLKTGFWVRIRQQKTLFWLFKVSYIHTYESKAYILWSSTEPRVELKSSYYGYEGPKQDHV